MHGTSKRGGRVCGLAVGAPTAYWLPVLVLLAQLGLAAPVQATPGVAAAPPLVYKEDFENNADNSPTGAKSFSVPGAIYTGVGGQTFTGAAGWINGANCDGVILSASNTTTPPWAADCGGIFPRIGTLARALGAGGGAGAGDALNHAQSAYTQQSAPLGTGFPNGVMFQTVTPIPVPINRFYTFQVNTSSDACTAGQTHPLFNFGIINSTNTFSPVTAGDVDTCSAPFTLDAGGFGTRLKTVISTSSVLYSQSSLRVVLYNNQSNQNAGNDVAFDNVTLFDSTPQLDKTFAPTSTSAGTNVVMTLTVTNTTDLVPKSGWGFVETLPAGLVISTPANIVSTCAAPTSGTTSITAVAGANSLTVSNGALAGGSPNNCTISVNVTSATVGSYTNTAANITSLTGLLPPSPATVVFTPPPTVNIQKTTKNAAATVSGIFTFAFTGLAVPATYNSTIVGNNAGVRSPDFTGVVGTAVTFTETVPAGWPLYPYQTSFLGCTDSNFAASGNPSAEFYPTRVNNSFTIPASYMVPGARLVCNAVNYRAKFQLAKIIMGTPPDGGRFNLQISGGNVSTTGNNDNTTPVVNPALNVGNLGQTDFLGVDVASSITFSETAAAGTSLTNYNATISCVSSSGGIPYVGAINPVSPGVWTIQSPAANVVGPARENVCTITNTPRPPRVTLAKTSINGTGSFNFTLSGVTTTTETIATVTAGTKVTSATVHTGTAGTAATITETPVLGYSTSASCIDANSAGTGNTTPVTSSTNVVAIPAANMKSGADYTCSFTNTRLIANLSVVKTANPTNVQTGGTVTFTLTVNNAGPAAANGSILRDKPGAGLTCTAAPSCTASGGASCPSALALTAPAITSNAGVPIPVLPNGGQVVVTMVCTATASGQ